MLFIHISAAIIGLSGLFLLSIGILRAIFLQNHLKQGTKQMHEIASYIKMGAYAFLYRQYNTVGLIACIMLVILLAKLGIVMAYGFTIGVIFSSLAGILGMIVAVNGNVLIAAQACEKTDARAKAAKASVNFGSIISCIVTGLGLLALFLTFFAPVYYLQYAGREFEIFNVVHYTTLGLGLGASLVSIFGRVAGGIFTKAADIGADLVGKLENSLPEDDPRNPAVIADCIGDNVGDCAGMAADVFETFVISIVAIGQILFSCYARSTIMSNVSLFLVSIIGFTSIIGCISTFFFSLKPGSTVIRSLYNMILYAVAVCVVGIIGIAYSIFGNLTTKMTIDALQLFNSINVTPLILISCVIAGFALTAAVILITTYYTDSEYRPVRSIAQSSNNGHATNIIYGLSVGMESTFSTVLAICITFGYCYYVASMIGISLAVASMISLTIIIMTLDAYGPMTDNAGGIAEMSGLDKAAREITDELDAAGNTTKAITKGYAISAAALCSSILTVLYIIEMRCIDLSILAISEPLILIGLLLGGMIPYIFSAFNMKYVGLIGGKVVEHVREQFKLHPKILEGKELPNYGYTVDYLTKESIKAMIIPALMPVAIPVVLAICFYRTQKLFVLFAGMNVGVLISGIFLSLTLTNAGGAWDNAKKYIEQGNHGGKRSVAHLAAITGDTVGDPCKDTAGPAINPLIKVVNLITILLVMFIR